VDLEVEGDGVEAILSGLANVESVQRQSPIDGRQRYVMSVSGEWDVRPEIFRLAKEQDWVVWDLHEEVPRLEDLFHSLTAEKGAEVPDELESELE
jgi:hypothetical protein